MVVCVTGAGVLRGGSRANGANGELDVVDGTRCFSKMPFLSWGLHH